MTRKLCALFAFLVVLSGSSSAQLDNVLTTIRDIESRCVPDKRVVVFDVKVQIQNDTLILTGETSHPEAYHKLMELKSENVRNHVRLLPDEVIGEKNRGVIYNSVVKLYSDRSYSSEVVSELLLGMPVKLFDKKGGWRRIQTPEGYIGWISEAVTPMTESELHAYNTRQKIVINVQSTNSYEEADVQSTPVSDLVIGNILELKGDYGSFFHVLYPNGRTAYVQKSEAEKVEKWLNGIHFTQESVVNTAKQFTGIPYVWGGSSPKGLDCSGFTKLIYFLHGVILPRDASQQIFCGESIDEADNFDALLPGDLLFFGVKATEENQNEKVIHVGIYIGNRRFIHASDFIQIGSFDSLDTLYDAYNTNRYLRAKRILGVTDAIGVEQIFDNELYK